MTRICQEGGGCSAEASLTPLPAQRSRRLTPFSLCVCVVLSGQLLTAVLDASTSRVLSMFAKLGMTGSNAEDAKQHAVRSVTSAVTAAATAAATAARLELDRCASPLHPHPSADSAK